MGKKKIQIIPIHCSRMDILVKSSLHIHLILNWNSFNSLKDLGAWTARKCLWASSTSWPNLSFLKKQIWTLGKFGQVKGLWRGKRCGWQSKLSYCVKLQSLNHWEFTAKGILLLSKLASNISRFCHMHKTRIENCCLKGEQPFMLLTTNFSSKKNLQTNKKPPCIFL